MLHKKNKYSERSMRINLFYCIAYWDADYLIMLNMTACISNVCLETDIFIIIYVNIDDKEKIFLKKMNEYPPFNCRRKLNCYSLGS